MTTTLLVKRAPHTSVSTTTLGTLTLDAMPTATHAGEVEVTDHPVESGSNVVDHRREKPETLQLEGVVGSVPLTQEQRDAFGAGVDRAQSAYDLLLQLKASSELLTIVTPRRTYDSMVMVSLSVPESAQTGDALSFTATFKEIRVVVAQTVQVPTIPAAKARDKGGKKDGAPVDAPEREKTNARLLGNVFYKLFTGQAAPGAF